MPHHHSGVVSREIMPRPPVQSQLIILIQSLRHRDGAEGVDIKQGTRRLKMPNDAVAIIKLRSKMPNAALQAARRI